MKKRIPVWRKDQKLERLADHRVAGQTYTAEFHQRPGSKLRTHVKEWILRTSTFEYTRLHFKMARHTQLTDVHLMFGLYHVVVKIGTEERSTPLHQIAALGGSVGVAPVQWISGPATIQPWKGKYIRVELRNMYDAQRFTETGAFLQRRGEGGEGFSIKIEIQGVRTWDEKDKSPSADKTQRPRRK